MRPDATQAIEAALAKVPLFEEVSPLLVRQLAGRARLVKASPGAVIFREGEPGGTLAVLVEGTVSVTRATAQGERLLARRGPGDVLGELALLDQGTRSATVTADSDLRLVLLDAAGFESVLRGSRGFALELIRVLARRLRDAGEGVGSAGKVHERLAAYLLRECGEAQELRLTLTKTALAERLGARRETVSRAFAQLAEARLIRVSGRVVRLLDRGSLEEVAAEAGGV